MVVAVGGRGKFAKANEVAHSDGCCSNAEDDVEAERKRVRGGDASEAIAPGALEPEPEPDLQRLALLVIAACVSASIRAKNSLEPIRCSN